LVDPELMIRMPLVGYCFGIRSERCLCEEVQLNLACRRFCRLGLEGASQKVSCAIAPASLTAMPVR
jgi:transposase